jgi:hypothetical protein
VKRFFVSYPKSGRTWVRYIFLRLELEEAVRFHHDQFGFKDRAKPPLDFELEPRLARYARVERLVYFERDPRDVMLSLYGQITGRYRDKFGYTGGISAFLRDPYFGAESLRRFRDMWGEMCRRLGFQTESYEACHADTAGTVRRMLDYYGLAASDAALAQAVTAARIESMREAELAGAVDRGWLRPKGGWTKVGRGEVGGYRAALSAADIEYLNRVFDL